MMTKIIEYPSTDLTLWHFRQIAAETTGRRAIAPLEKIMAVGAPFDVTSARDALFKRDVKFLGGVFDRLYRAAIPISADFTLTPLDLRYGQDFLDPANNLKTDILVISFIAGIDHPERAKTNLASAPHFLSSPFDTGIDIWQKAAEKTEAKIIISFYGTEHDINVDRFKSDLYVSGRDSWLSQVMPKGSCSMSSLIRKDYYDSLKMQPGRPAQKADARKHDL